MPIFLRTDLGCALLGRLVHKDHLALLPRAKVITLCSLLSLLTFVVLGLSLDYLCRYGFGHPSSGQGYIIGSFAVAFVAGFLVPGAPAGMGVRESILILLLEPVYGRAPALGAAALSRLAQVAADGLVFLLAVLMRSSQQCLDGSSSAPVAELQ